MGTTAPGIVTGHLLVAQFAKTNIPMVVPSTLGLGSATSIGLALSFALFVYGTSLVIYRLWFSPISHIPGPKLAAATGWYQAYYTVVHYGRWCFKVKELHEEYGPIVRINPWEISIRDADFYPSVTSPTPARRIEAHLGAGFEGTGLAGGSVGFTISHELHRDRRKPLEPFFSKKVVEERLESMVKDMAMQLKRRILAKQGTGELITPDHMIVALSTDVAAKHVYGETFGLFEDEDFSPHWAETINTWIRYCPLAVTFPWAISLILALPDFLQALFKPKGFAWGLPGMLVDKLLSTTPIPAFNPHSQKSDQFNSSGPPNMPIGKALLLDPSIPHSDKLRDRMVSQLSAIVLAAAGPRLLASGMYYILSTPWIESRLRAELSVLLTPYVEANCAPTSSAISKLPYLNACMKESFRLAMGIVRQLPKSHVDDDLYYKGYVIPAGTALNFWTFLQHYDEDVFPLPWTFRPERWLTLSQGGDVPDDDGGQKILKRMEKHMIPFGRGGRSCLGRNLVHVVMYHLLAVFFGPDCPQLKLFDTDESDVRFERDCFAAFPKLNTKGVRCTVE
ncbi:Cytochrome P450 [Rhypophila sp. PSN 637]